MSRCYLDTSAAAKLVVEEAESDALADELHRMAPTLVGCLLLETELRRLVAREPALTQQAVTQLLRGVELYELPPPLFTEAGLLPGSGLRSLDSLHLAAAVRLEVESVITYDRRMAEAATSLGMDVLAPA
ncbi:PIN domain-containing protein [Nocardioides eburneiflavus]|uniref:Ribonuclease VapC n=1 Tax=Nocardioides eburneiflavus TaxID=2518372 RepID=A0A4Z1BRD4_9ACTN|nr:type II toxin-antitoxin system VapC family toxin [Nocardioides eburneiflavus]TGN63891.1 PIN domain-containing protein [Nocardioides eburneiflavus]